MFFSITCQHAAIYYKLSYSQCKTCYLIGRILLRPGYQLEPGPDQNRIYIISFLARHEPKNTRLWLAAIDLKVPGRCGYITMEEYIQIKYHKILFQNKILVQKLNQTRLSLKYNFLKCLHYSSTVYRNNLFWLTVANVQYFIWNSCDTKRLEWVDCI